MKKFIKLTALLLCIVMLTSTLAGCGLFGGGDDEPEDEFNPPYLDNYYVNMKFYSNRVKMDERLNTNIEGLHCLGDSSGWTRGLMMASVMGVYMGRILLEEEAGK